MRGLKTQLIIYTPFYKNVCNNIKKYTMADNNFKVGDCVELKHNGGGIKMTINTIEMYRGQDSAQCRWYNKKDEKFELQVFALEALKPCTDGANS